MKGTPSGAAEVNETDGESTEEGASTTLVVGVIVVIVLLGAADFVLYSKSLLTGVEKEKKVRAPEKEEEKMEKEWRVPEKEEVKDEEKKKIGEEDAERESEGKTEEEKT